MESSARAQEQSMRLVDRGLAPISVESSAPAHAGRRDFVLRRFLLAGDLLSVAAAIVAATLISGTDHVLWGLVTLPLWAVLFQSYGLYERDGRRISHPTVDDAPAVFHALVIGSLLLWFVYKVGPGKLVLEGGLVFFFLAFVGVLATRSFTRRMARARTTPERALFVGDGPIAEVLARKLANHPEYAVEPVGCLAIDDATPCGLRQLGTMAQLEEVCARERIERVVMLPTADEDALIDLIRRTQGMQLRLSLVPSAMDVLGPAVEIDDVEGITVLGVNPPVLTRSSRALKRTMDVTLAAGALLVFAPAMALIALVVTITSPGPALFRQERIGLSGRRFRLIKFRTMHVDAEARVAELRAQSRDPRWLLLDHDPRITRPGRFLRMSSLDELPQLWNVIRGDMSLVGPRPLTPADHVQVMSGWGWRRLDLTPGITGLWQVLGRTRIPFEEMVKLDYLYVTNWSLWGDVRLLIRTLPVVLRRSGAN